MPLWPVSRADPRRATPLQELDYVVLDTELTSLDRKTNRLLSVGALKMHGARIELGSEFYHVMNPGVAVPGHTVIIHKLRDNDVAEGEPPATVLSALSGFIGSAVVVGHFTKVDVDVLQKEFAGVGIRLDFPAIDTARVYRWLEMRRKYRETGWEHGGENLALQSLAERYGIPVQDAHHALDDAFVTAQLWQRLLYELDREGVRVLRQALRIAKA